MHIDSRALLTDLTRRTRQVLQTIEQELLPLSEKQLNHKPGPDSWSALECIAHLNRYGAFYLPELQRVLSAAKRQPVRSEFRSGWLGNYFAQSMLPQNGEIKKMKTLAPMNPAGSKLTSEELRIFIKQLNKMLEYFKAAETVDLTRNKTGVSISKWIKLRLGDTLRFVTYHNERHLQQALRAVQTVKVPGELIR